ncbi:MULTISPECIES: GNAT family protein [Rhizobium]|uniref:GNAT family N-acetyltransferase n=1 Tax=Rhizobium tropici TaxID=398 RepID=A0A329YE76_RHITR|nr:MULTISPECIES: GNAT family protein [Rhizobium]MBB3285959.1 RimJ/RimL family protein N-acetyltransferase [Rhizobium sp. BK252]MBB3400879.1 RimJ/RimL family protein N-acetyltransferase [Rhizobium sp. BK289]MBB3413277.1 RimJ/RimL family protein N-acetyltransferase [Rhizobium sp. BK284]MBB3481345.1 RimJ/RimL family protein N-acetyltransferase [Rhizobium sp. BK347]MDK4723174.1 GNAT family protein [Rhizobium sp. CNPSo 3968]
MTVCSEIRIEPITAEHIEDFHKALDMVAREREYLSLLEAFPLEETRAFVLGMIENGNPQLVALADGTVVGWCDISRHTFPSNAHAGKLGMGLIPAYRGQGLGRRLIEATLRAARDVGIERVELSVYADNNRAIALYEKVGFVREGLARKSFRIDGRYKDTIHMAFFHE